MGARNPLGRKLMRTVSVIVGKVESVIYRITLIAAWGELTNVPRGTLKGKMRAINMVLEMAFSSNVGTILVKNFAGPIRW